MMMPCCCLFFSGCTWFGVCWSSNIICGLMRTGKPWTSSLLQFPVTRVDARNLQCCLLSSQNTFFCFVIWYMSEPASKQPVKTHTHTRRLPRGRLVETDLLLVNLGFWSWHLLVGACSMFCVFYTSAHVLNDFSNSVSQRQSFPVSLRFANAFFGDTEMGVGILTTFQSVSTKTDVSFISKNKLTGCCCIGSR